eukprot:56749_1
MITVDEIYEVFQQLGFHKKHTKKEIKKMFKAVDIDGNGTIDLDEFIGLLRTKKTGKYDNMSYADELKAEFQLFDTDGNGEIDAEELSTVMQALGEKVSKKYIEFMIKSFDLDGGGTIDF